MGFGQLDLSVFKWGKVGSGGVMSRLNEVRNKEVRLGMDGRCLFRLAEIEGG